MIKRDPLNIALFDIDKCIKDENLLEVTSEFIRESSTNKYHPDGLFSERIFGDVATTRRLTQGGYIKLNCKVFHPIIYQNLHALKRFYTEIMSGVSYAVWDGDLGDFVRADEMEEGADTGFTFFLKHFDHINFRKNTSIKRGDRVDVIEKFKKLRLIDKMYVAPAGLRDIKEEGSRVEKDSVNALYASLLRNARSMTKGADTNPLFDSVHYTIQKRVNEIYDQISNLVRGKGGFFEGKYSHRAVARGTRNVITATDMEAESPDSPQYHKITETRVPLFQASKAAADHLVYWFKTLFYDQVINATSENIAVINPNNYKLEYVTLDVKTKDMLTTTEGIEKTIDRFRDPFNRFKPVQITIDKKPYYLFLCYDRGDKINIFRNLDEFKTQLDAANIPFDESKLKPLKFAEMLYIAAYAAYRGVHATTTRYPVTDEQSIFVSSTHLMTTAPARVVRFLQGPTEDPTDMILPEFPVEGAKFVDALMLHPTRLKSLCADFDGNCVAGNSTVELRYPVGWIDAIKLMMKSKVVYNPGAEGYSTQDLDGCLNRLNEASYAAENGYRYATIRIGSFPQIGRYTLDKNGAKVYDVPAGIEVLSYLDGVPTYLPIQKFTVEDSCETVLCVIGGRYVRVSTNKSLAVFSHSTGELVKVEPGIIGCWGFTPVIKQSARVGGNTKTKKAKYSYGYNRGKYLMLTDSDLKSLRGLPTEALIGVVVSLINRFGTVAEADEYYAFDRRRPCISIKVNTAYEADIVHSILYMAGLMWTSEDAYVRDSGNGIRFGINAEGFDKYLPHIKFSKPAFNKACSKWRESISDLKDEYDFIPVTKVERRRLLSLADGNPEDEKLFRNPTNWYFKRYLLKKYLKKDDGTKLSSRVYADNVEWVLTSVIPESAQDIPVYDFVVPGSKVYAVNNGVIVYDTCSWIPIFSKEANAECEKYIHTQGNYILPSGQPLADMFDDLIKLSMHAMTREPPELKK